MPVDAACRLLHHHFKGLRTASGLNALILHTHMWSRTRSLMYIHTCTSPGSRISMSNDPSSAGAQPRRAFQKLQAIAIFQDDTSLQRALGECIAG